jgi:hypothetical protein
MKSPAKAGSSKSRTQSHTQWSLLKLMDGLHQRVEHDLHIARQSFGHPGAMGDASQSVWIRLLQSYLPERYHTQSATLVDSCGHFSEQIDVVVYDRQYSPLLLNFEGQAVIPVEAVYAVFEAKQALRGEYLRYAQKKVASVRRLVRTSIPVQTVDGVRPPKVLQPILGGFLALESRSDSRGPQSFERILAQVLPQTFTQDKGEGRLDLGCIAAVGTFGCGPRVAANAPADGTPPTSTRARKKKPASPAVSIPNGTAAADPPVIKRDDRAATSFVLELMSRLQECGTVPAIDIRTYASWLNR